MNIYDMFKLLPAVSTQQLDIVAMYTHIYKYICICYICTFYIHFLNFHTVDYTTSIIKIK